MLTPQLGREFQSFSCVRKETFDIDILVASRNGDIKNHANYQNNEQTSLKKKKAKPVEPVLRNIYQSNTYRKDLSWPHFGNEPRQVKSNSHGYLFFQLVQVATSNNQEHQPRHDNSIPYMGIWQIYRDTEQPHEKEISQNKPRLQVSWMLYYQQG